jgi:hypothetical protein
MTRGGLWPLTTGTGGCRRSRGRHFSFDIDVVGASLLDLQCELAATGMRRRLDRLYGRLPLRLPARLEAAVVGHVKRMQAVVPRAKHRSGPKAGREV